MTRAKEITKFCMLLGVLFYHHEEAEKENFLEKGDSWDAVARYPRQARGLSCKEEETFVPSPRCHASRLQQP